ncbi:MAG: helix-turn-helix domain-containing protein [Candidatus Limnocylindrales bacterium]
MSRRPTATTEAAGERLRRARLAVGRSRESVGDQIGVSASMIGRMERGEGDGLLVRRWVAAADALGFRLRVTVEQDADDHAAQNPRPRVLTVDVIRRFATPGGWVVSAYDDFLVVLDRPARRERLHVYLCDVPVEILDAADVCSDDRADALATLPDGWRVSVVILVRAELPDRYRPMHWLGHELRDFGSTGGASIAAIKSPRAVMPGEDVILWCDERATRLIPFGLSLEPGRRPPRTRPEVRRRACPRRSAA